MNTYTLSLSSPSSSYISRLDSIYFDDHTKLTLDLSNIRESIIPNYVKINWGLTVDSIIYDNDVYSSGRDDINTLRFSKVLNDTYSFEYYPSSTSLYKNLSAQVLVNYTNGDNAWFIIPIQIRTYDYFESIGDIKLINTNILPLSGNPLEYQLASTNDNQLIELRTIK